MKTITQTMLTLGLLLTVGLDLRGQKPGPDLKPYPLLMVTSPEIGLTIELWGDNGSKSYQFCLQDLFMLEDCVLNRTDREASAGSEFVVREERDAKIAIEDWMLESQGQTGIKLAELIREAEEAPIPLQDWMLCCKEWKISRL